MAALAIIAGDNELIGGLFGSLLEVRGSNCAHCPIMPGSDSTTEHKSAFMGDLGAQALSLLLCFPSSFKFSSHTHTSTMRVSILAFVMAMFASLAIANPLRQRDIDVSLIPFTCSPSLVVWCAK